MMRFRPLLLIPVLFLLAACGSNPAMQSEPIAESTPLVLTSVAPIYSMTAALLADTPVEVQNVPERARSMGSQPTWFRTQGETFEAQFEQADAVVSMDHLWHQDPLYVATRERNVRVVQIDATLPFSSQATGVSVVNSGADGFALPMFWLSPANVIRSTKLIATDLQRLYPEQAEQIRANEQAITSALLAEKARGEAQLLQVADPFVYALADEFDYVTNEFGIFVDGYFIKQDLDWTEEDLANLSQHLQDWDIPVVIHKWEPSDAIKQAIADGGAELVILDTYETASTSLQDLSMGNINKLLAALAE